MHMHPFDALPLTAAGSLIFTPCPGTKEVDIATSLSQLKSAGCDAVISLMQDEEFERFEVTDIGPLCKHLDLAWYHWPIEDDAAPEAPFEQCFSKQKQQVVDRLKQGQNIAVHCKGGTGRTGLVIALLLLELGYSHVEAVAMVQQIRPKSLRNEAQLAYVMNYLPG